MPRSHKEPLILIPDLGLLVNLTPIMTPGWVYIIQYSPSSAARVLENIGPAARAIRKINSSNIAQPGKTILDVSFLEIDNVCIMTQVRIYGEI